MEHAQRAPAPASGPPGERELLHLMDVLGAVTPVGRGEAGDLAPSAHATRPAPRPRPGPPPAPPPHGERRGGPEAGRATFVFPLGGREEKHGLDCML